MSAQHIPLHIIIVTHNSRKHILPCLHSLPEALTYAGQSTRAIITVVDSGSVDGTPDTVANEFPGVRLICLPDNVGWARGINLAAQSGDHHLLLLNPDTQPMPGSIALLMQALRERPCTGAVGPALLSREGTVAPESARAAPSLWHEFTDKVGIARRWPGSPLVGKYYIGRDLRPRPVPALSGAALLIRRSAWEDVGGLDKEFWLYAGDTDLCRRLWRAGWECLYYPQARVVHIGGASVPADGRIEMGIEALEAMYRYFSRHRGRGYALAYRLLMGTTALAKTPYWLVRRSGHHLRVQWRVLLWSMYRASLAKGRERG